MTQDFFKCIEDKIKTDCPAFRTVELYRGQDLAFNERTQKSKRLPAVFVEFIVDETISLAYGIKDYLMTVRLRLRLENYSDRRDKDLNVMEDLRATMDRFRGGDSALVGFTSWEEQFPVLDPDHDQVNEPILEYRTKMRYTKTYERNNETTVTGPVSPVITRQKI